MSIRTKIIILFLLATIIPFVTIGIVAYVDSQKVLETLVIDKLNALATVQKNRVVFYLKQEDALLQTFSHNSVLLSSFLSYSKTKSKLDQAKLQEIINDEKNATSFIKEIYLLNKDGRIIASTARDTIGENHAYDEFFLKGQEKNTVGLVFKTNDNQIRQYITGPIRTNGQIFGIAVLEADTNELFAIFHDYTGLDKTGDWGLSEKKTNGDEFIIVPSRFNTNINAPLSKILSTNSKLPAVQALSGNEQISTNSIDFRKKEVIIATRFIPEVNWGLVVKIDKEEAYLPIYNLENQLLFYGMIIVLCALFLGLLLSDVITKPINIISKASARIRDGDLSAYADVKNHDEIGQLATIFNDMVDELKKFYEDLEKAKSKDDIILDSLGEGLIVVDTIGTITIANHQIQQMLNLSLNEIIGKRAVDVIPLVDTQGKVIDSEKRPIMQSLKHKNTNTLDGIYINNKNSKKTYIFAIAIPLIFEDKLDGVIGLYRNITREKEIEMTKDEFLSIAAHQLRTPLGTTRWNIERLLAGKVGTLSKKTKLVLKNLSESNLRLIHLVNALLNVSRINQGRYDENPEIIDVLETVRRVVKQEKTLAKSKSIVIKLIKPVSVLPKLYIDQKFFIQIIENIIENAVKYNQVKGIITISIHAQDSMIQISIADTGIGIPQNEQSSIFTKFHRATNATKNGIEGTGLGLFIVKSYINRWKGKIWFESQLGEGTTFYIQLPISKDKI